jgi:hypothetical protein
VRDDIPLTGRLSFGRHPEGTQIAAFGIHGRLLGPVPGPGRTEASRNCGQSPAATHANGTPAASARANMRRPSSGLEAKPTSSGTAAVSSYCYTEA